MRNNIKTEEVIDREPKNNNDPEEENTPLLHLVTSSHIETRELDPEACKQERLPIQRSRSADFGYNIRRFNPLVLTWSMERRSLTWNSTDTGKSEFQGILNRRYQHSGDPTSTSKLRLATNKVRVVSLSSFIPNYKRYILLLRGKAWLGISYI